MRAMPCRFLVDVARSRGLKTGYPTQEWRGANRHVDERMFASPEITEKLFGRHS